MIYYHVYIYIKNYILNLVGIIMSKLKNKLMHQLINLNLRIKNTSYFNIMYAHTRFSERGLPRDK